LTGHNNVRQFPQPQAGHALRVFRETRGLTGKDFSTQTGIASGHLSELENGRKNLTDALLARICTGFGLEPAALEAELEQAAITWRPPAQSLFSSPSPILMDETAEYRAPARDESFRDLSLFLVASIEQSAAWDMVRELTLKAQAGDSKSARCAKALIEILSELHHL